MSGSKSQNWFIYYKTHCFIPIAEPAFAYVAIESRFLSLLCTSRLVPTKRTSWAEWIISANRIATLAGVNDCVSDVFLSLLPKCKS